MLFLVGRARHDDERRGQFAREQEKKRKQRKCLLSPFSSLHNFCSCVCLCVSKRARERGAGREGGHRRKEMCASLPAAQACRGGQGRLEPAAAAPSCGFQHMQPKDACTQDRTYAHTCARVLSSACVEELAASISYHLFQARLTQRIAT